MSNVLLNIRIISDTLAQQHNLNVGIFFIVYILSFVPFYLGYFLIIYGSTRTLNIKDIFRFRLKNKLQWNDQSKIGLYVHLFGRVMPYAYIIIYGRNLSIWIYIGILVLIATIIIFFLTKIISAKDSFIKDINIFREDSITNPERVSQLWNIYDKTFEKVNKLSPCKQSFDHGHFVDVLQDTTVRKYLIDKVGSGIIGIGLITDNFKNTPWISEDYFTVNFPTEHSKKLIFYFLGLAIDENFRNRKYSINLMEHIIDDLPHTAVMGFDHSRNINPMLHHFTRIVRQSDSIKGNHIDRQHYHVVRRK